MSLQFVLYALVPPQNGSMDHIMIRDITDADYKLDYDTAVVVGRSEKLSQTINKCKGKKIHRILPTSM